MSNAQTVRFSPPTLWVIVGLIIPMTAFGHHGSNANPALYFADNLLELEGEITGVFWRNPHPRLMLTVVGGDGVETDWELELAGSVNSLYRDGINDDLVRIGDQVRAAGAVSRRNPSSIGLQNLLLPSGEEFTSGNRETRWTSDRLATTRPSVDPAVVRAAEESAQGLFRIWGRRLGGRPQPGQFADLLTDQGRALAAQYHAPADNPELDCRSGFPNHMFDPVPMEITDGGDRIQIHTEEYSIRRVVYLTEDRPEPVPSNVGYSIGRWEGDTLVVETTHVDWPYIDPYGTPQSGQASYVETFRVADDESQLNYTIVMTDPVMFTAPLELARGWRWEPGTTMADLECIAEWGGSD